MQSQSEKSVVITEEEKDVEVNTQSRRSERSEDQQNFPLQPRIVNK